MYLYQCCNCNKHYVEGADHEGDPALRISKCCRTNPTVFVRNLVSPPSVIGDSMPGGSIDGIQSMADGKYYDSKSSYYKSLKAQGLAITDGTSNKQSAPDIGSLDQDIRNAIQQHGG